jgi:uncharacterized protein YutE (UPF0331/DUF86 family)
MGREVQTRLDDFYQVESYDQHEALNRICQTHVRKMSDILNEAFRRLFGEDYIERC